MKTLFLILAVLLAPLPAAGERFVSLGVPDGLGNRKVYQVCQDSDGYVWFYTQGSIDRYDGFEFRHYVLGHEATEGNYEATSNTLALDCDGVLHIAQTNGKVYRYNKESDALESAFNVNSGLLYALLFGDKDTWLGTSQGMFPLSGGDNILPGRSVRCLCSGADKVFAGTDTGVFECDGSVAVQLQAVPRVAVTAIYALEDGSLFIGTFSDGAFFFDRSTGLCSRLSPSFPQVPVRKIIRRGNHILFGTDGAGVTLYDLDTRKLSGSYKDDDTEGSLCADTVSDIYSDRDGILWVTTTTNGICYMNPGQPVPQWIRHQAGESNSLVSDHVNCILEDSSSRLWFGTNKGVSRLDNGRWHNFNIPGADVILMLREDENGTVWAGGYGLPVFSIDSGDRVSILDRGMFHYVFSLTVSGDRLWIGDLNDNLTGVGLKDGDRLTYPLKEVWDLYSSEGTVWVASHDGLAMIPSGGGDLCRIPLPDGVTGGWCITEDGEGRIWCGMENGGIICYNPADGNIINYPLDKTVFSILPDSSGKIWAVSGDQIYRLDPGRGVPVVMNRFLGIEDGEFNHTAAALLSDGRMAFGTAYGVLIFDPASLGDEAITGVSPVLTSFRLLSGDAQQILKGRAVNTLERIVLPWDGRSFELSFSALKMTSQARINFRYMLKGHDKQAHGSLTAGSAVYNGLPAGHYTFTVQAVDSLTGDTLGTKDLRIVVRRPVLLSGVAIGLYALLVAAAFYLFVRFRRRKRLREMTQERLDTFIRFAHELKTPVSLIKGPLTALDKDSDLSLEDKESVSTALRNTDRLMDMINSLLDLREDGAGDNRLNLESCDLRDYLGETLNAFLPAAKHKGIDLTYSVADGLGDVLIDREKMDHVLQNLISNSVKYTEKGYVKVTAKPAGRTWRLQVQDTGIGIPAEVRSRIFYGGIRAANARNVDETGYGIGLMITRQLVLQHHGSISLSSEEGSGTTFNLSFPMEYRASECVVLPSPEPAREKEETAPGSARARILIVEDDAEMLRYLRDLLSPGYEISGAPDGRAAVKMAEESQPDLVLTDVIMPGMNGFDLCRHLKSAMSTSHIPVILLTAMDDREHVIMGLESGCDDYIVKPFDTQVLHARISNLLHERERLRSLVLQSGRREKQREYTNRLDKEFMEKVLSSLEASYPDPEFQIDDLCRSVAMSRTAFFNKLKALSGKGPNDFIRIYRLNKAKELLEGGEYTIAEVSDMVGFSDAKYFSSCFKKAFGVSPSKY